MENTGDILEEPAVVELNTEVAKFTCDKCKKDFITKQQLVGHMSKGHKRGKNVSVGDYSCGKCPKKFKLLRALQGHQRIHYTQNVQQDLANADDIIDLNEVQQPAPALIGMENVGEIIALDEGQQPVHKLVQIGNVDEMERPVVIESGAEVATIPCNQCNKFFNTNQQLVGHKSRAHKHGKKVSQPDGDYSCVICLRHFQYLRAFQAHRRVHPKVSSNIANEADYNLEPSDEHE